MPRALIVEDEPEANELLAMLVRLRGYQTDSAFDGSSALLKAKESRPDVVFLDLMLPDINGFEICQTLKGSRPTTAIPVVMVTARLTSDNRLQGFRAGATDYVPKPYTPDQIFGALDQADTWSRTLAQGSFTGVIPIATDGAVESVREITRLWSVILEQTRVSESDARSIDRGLIDLCLRAIDWGLRHEVGLVATLSYQVHRNDVSLRLQDESGWLERDSPEAPEGLGGLLARCSFDRVDYDSRGRHVALIRHDSPDR